MTYRRRETFLPFTRPVIGQDGAPSAKAEPERERMTRCHARSGGSQGLAEGSR